MLQEQRLENYLNNKKYASQKSAAFGMHIFYLNSVLML